MYNLTKKHLILILILFSSLVMSFIAKAQYPVIKLERPRIYLDSDRIAYLKQNINAEGDCKKTYDDVVYAYDNWWINDPQLYLLGLDSTKWTWDWSSQWAADELIITVLFYKLKDDSLGLKRCRFIAEKFIEKLENADFVNMEWYDKENMLRQMSDAGGILLDWCYNDLPLKLRQDLAKSMYIMNREFMNTFILSSAGYSYVSSHNTWNNIFCNQNTLVLYEADGLTETQKDTVIIWYQTVYDKLTNGFIPCWSYYRDDDGGWNWGAAYSMWSLVDQFQLFENMRIATDKNFFQDLPWVRNSINQYLYFIQPDRRCIHLGDGETLLHSDRVMYLHARHFSDPKSLWLAQYYSQPAMLTWTIPKLNKLLYKDFEVTEVQHHNSDLDWYADKVGLSVSFSSWEKDAAMVTFFNSPSKRAAHEHRDNNSFTIFKNNPLLIDAGYYDTYGGVHYRNYYQRTIAHNSICVFDSTESFSCFGQPASNDGGQIESRALQNYEEIFLSENQRGKWIKYHSDKNFIYNIADAQMSYDTSKLSLFRRRLFYLKPDKVVVLDHIHLKNTATRQRDIKWVGHCVNKPDINGSNTKSLIPGHIETYDGQDYRITNGSGNLSIRTLLPKESEATLTGGKDYEYWVEGTNYSPLSIPDSLSNTPGNWRIEVRPKKISDTVIYLHTLNIGDDEIKSKPGGLLVQNENSIVLDWDNELFFFPSKGDTGILYHLVENIAGDRKVELYALDLKTDKYDIKLDDIVISEAISVDNKVLYSEINLNQGLHKIEIMRNATTIPEILSGGPINIYPNPAGTMIYFEFNKNCSQSEIYIYNSAGEKLMKLKNSKSADISKLLPGIYYVQSICETNFYSGKFLKL